MIHFLRFRLAILIASLAFALCGHASPNIAADDELAEKLKARIGEHEGDVAVVVKHIPTGKSFEHRSDEPMPTASLIKLAVMVEAYQQAHDGKLDLEQKVSLREEDKVPGSGILTTHFSEGLQMPLQDAIRLMIAYSDNTATNLVVDQIGVGSVAERMESLGYPDTKLHAKVFRRDTSVFPERSQQFGLGSTTAAEMVGLLERLHKQELVSEQASQEMLEHLRHCEDNNKLARFLPAEASLAHKTGSVSDVRTDAGIMTTPAGPILICVLTRNNKDRSWGEQNAAELLAGEIARDVYRHYNPDRASRETTETPEAVAMGASGVLVEDLQRTLNARLSPSPELSVDGDFGPVTEEAVRRFQQERGLEVSGKVGDETWKALGPLLTKDEPVPAPDVVNSEVLDRSPAEDLDAPPLVSCKAWAIADGKTGKLLWSDRADEPLDMASTTKMMTGYLVCKLAEEQPMVLEEEIQFSKRADETIGSTSGIRAGERVAVRELLYGLLLPSGNDASVAIAEHFGKRLAPAGADQEQDPLELFVAAMNDAAAQLGMNQTHFKNPHGLTHEQHRTSAVDLLRLAHAAMQNELFRNCVSTRQRGCTVEGAAGYARNVIWKNTNRLLAIDGYQGVKTGTTQAAGACLVSAGTHAERDLLVVVLGASSSDNRYIDTRNLFRWAWQQLASGPRQGPENPRPPTGLKARP